MNLPDKANETCVAQIAEALFGQPGMSLMEMANRRAEIEALVKDSARWNWLMTDYFGGNVARANKVIGACFSRDAMESAIDSDIAAMKEQAE